MFVFKNVQLSYKTADNAHLVAFGVRCTDYTMPLIYTALRPPLRCSIAAPLFVRSTSAESALCDICIIHSTISNIATCGVSQKDDVNDNSAAVVLFWLAARHQSSFVLCVLTQYAGCIQHGTPPAVIIMVSDH